MGEYGQETQYNLAFVWLEAPAPTLTVVKEFVNESHRTKSSDDIDQDKMTSLEARIRAIEER